MLKISRNSDINVTDPGSYNPGALGPSKRQLEEEQKAKAKAEEAQKPRTQREFMEDKLGRYLKGDKVQKELFTQNGRFLGFDSEGEVRWMRVAAVGGSQSMRSDKLISASVTFKSGDGLPGVDSGHESPAGIAGELTPFGYMHPERYKRIERLMTHNNDVSSAAMALYQHYGPAMSSEDFKRELIAISYHYRLSSTQKSGMLEVGRKFIEQFFSGERLGALKGAERFIVYGVLCEQAKRYTKRMISAQRPVGKRPELAAGYVKLTVSSKDASHINAMHCIVDTSNKPDF